MAPRRLAWASVPHMDGRPRRSCCRLCRYPRCPLRVRLNQHHVPHLLGRLRGRGRLAMAGLGHGLRPVMLAPQASLVRLKPSWERLLPALHPLPVSRSCAAAQKPQCQQHLLAGLQHLLAGLQLSRRGGQHCWPHTGIPNSLSPVPLALSTAPRMEAVLGFSSVCCR